MGREIETEARLAMAMHEAIRHLPPEQARKRAYAYGSVAHNELLKIGLHEDRATTMIEVVTGRVFAELGLGEPDEKP